MMLPDARRAVITWKGPGKPIVLTLYGADGEAVAVPLEPKRALTLANELLTSGVAAIKADPEAPWALCRYQGLGVEVDADHVVLERQLDILK